MGTDDFVRWERELFGVPESQEGMTAQRRTLIVNRDEALLRIFRDSGTNDFGRGIRYAAAETVIEFLDHESIVRGSDPEAARWERIMSGQTEAAEARAWSSLVEAAA
jgi:hypothetical protein